MTNASIAASPDEIRDIARDAYIYGAPMEDFYRVMYAFSILKGNPEYKGPFNSILNIARVFTPEDKAFVTPNSDTPYTFLGLDLRTEPVIITVPPIEPSRYFVFQLMDLFTYNFAYIGTRSTGNGGGNYLIASPGWKGDVPDGIAKVLHSETQLISVVGRTQLFNADDLEKVEHIQQGYNVQTLSHYIDRTAAPRPPLHDDWIAPLKPDEQRRSVRFFSVLNFILRFCPTPKGEEPLRARFARIGVTGDTAFPDVDSLPAATRDALLSGIADGQKAIVERRAKVGSDISGLFGTREFLDGDYVARAVGGQVGIGANSREEALYPIYENDADGNPLDGASGRYTLRFEPDSLPPVNAFWSLTMYDMPNQLLVANPIDRYLINSTMLPSLQRDTDGGLTLRIQNEPPAEGKSNWLPAPKGPFMLALRYYLPRPELLNGKWVSPKPIRVA